MNDNREIVALLQQKSIPEKDFVSAALCFSEYSLGDWSRVNFLKDILFKQPLQPQYQCDLLQQMAVRGFDVVTLSHLDHVDNRVEIIPFVAKGYSSSNCVLNEMNGSTSEVNIDYFAEHHPQELFDEYMKVLLEDTSIEFLSQHSQHAFVKDFIVYPLQYILEQINDIEAVFRNTTIDIRKLQQFLEYLPEYHAVYEKIMISDHVQTKGNLSINRKM